jgi:glutamate-1-semialdehyde aminotransferase
MERIGRGNMKAADPVIDKSEMLWKRSLDLIPAGTQTLSKGPTQYITGITPKYLQRGKGCHVWDVDGNEYIDYTMALLPVILGYAHEATDNAVRCQLNEGITFTLMHPLEVKLSEVLVEIIPCAEMVRFGKNGSDVTTAAVRLARACTGRDRVICCGYHGWQDWYIGTTSRNKGVPRAVRELTSTFRYNDISSLEALFDQHGAEVACVIMEPFGMDEPEGNFLGEVRDLTHKNGALLIFDEIIMAFRLALGGAQEYFDVEPDLATVGKGMANGMPISAVVGKREFMKEFEEVFFSFTFGGETLSLAASLSTIEFIRREKVITHLWKQGRKLRDGYNKIADDAGMAEVTSCRGLPPVNYPLFFESNGFKPLEVKSFFQQECIRRGVLFSGRHNLCFSHSDEDIAFTLSVYTEVMQLLKNALETKSLVSELRGEVVRPVFREVY